MLTQQETLLGRGASAESGRAREPRRTALEVWFAASGFAAMELASRLTSASHPDSGSFLVVCVSLSQDGFQIVAHRDWHLLSPSDLFQILQVSGNLLVPHSLQRPPVVR